MTTRQPSITVRHEPKRKTPWLCQWRDYVNRGGRKVTRVFATKAEADRFADDVLKEYHLTNRIRIGATPPTTDASRLENLTTTPGSVGEYLKDWVLNTVRPRRAGSTFRSYEGLIWCHVLSAPFDRSTFGKLPMKSLSPLIVRRLYDGLRERGVKLGTRKHVHTCLSSACTSAVQDEVLDRNPVLTLGRLLRHKDEDELDPEPNPFTPEEMIAFLKYAKKSEPEWFEYFQFLFDVGARVGEVAALKWDCIDLSGKRAEIVASYSPSDGDDKTPKTHQRRWVELTDVVVTQLTDLRRRQRVELLARGITPKGYAFTLKNGSPRRQDGNMRRVFNRVCEAIEATGHSPHDCRDTFATTHLSTDYANLPRVSRQLGHATEQTTVNHYFRYLPSKDSRGWVNAIRGGRR